jgi:acetoin utilization deacetylase AcuC-like enzyme
MMKAHDSTRVRRVGFACHDSFLRHKPSWYHPERPERVAAITETLKRSGMLDRLHEISPPPAEADIIQLVHSQAHISRIADACAKGDGWFDGDTYYCSASYESARYAAGAVVEAVKQVVDGDLDSAFCAVRPPGHHAERDQPRGFCLFNNIAIGAAFARERLGIDRVAILDWDVHHGNGTQGAFYSDRTVHYTSIHQFPFFPGSGAAVEKGEGDGEGFTMNFPLDAGSGDEEFLATLEVFWLPEMEKFKPELILISAGFDAHENDPLAGLSVSDSGFAKMTRLAMRAADLSASGRLVSVLEGGYDLDVLARSVSIHLNELMR